MPTAKSRIAHKHFRLDAVKLKKVQKALGAQTETETVERAFDLVLSEHERNEQVKRANREFISSGAIIDDVFGRLPK